MLNLWFENFTYDIISPKYGEKKTDRNLTHPASNQATDQEVSGFAKTWHNCLIFKSNQCWFPTFVVDLLVSYSYLQGHCKIHGDHQAGESNTGIHNSLDKISILGEYPGHERREAANYDRQEKQHHNNDSDPKLKTSYSLQTIR